MKYYIWDFTHGKVVMDGVFESEDSAQVAITQAIKSKVAGSYAWCPLTEREVEIEKYCGMPYTWKVIKCELNGESGWVASCEELQGCMTQGDTWEELGEMMQDAMHLWIESCLEDGVEIPLSNEMHIVFAI